MHSPDAGVRAATDRVASCAAARGVGVGQLAGRTSDQDPRSRRRVERPRRDCRVGSRRRQAECCGVAHSCSLAADDVEPDTGYGLNYRQRPRLRSDLATKDGCGKAPRLTAAR